MTMHAHRLKVYILKNSELRVQLPADVVTGEAEVIVLEVGNEAGMSRGCRQTAEEFLAARLVTPTGVGAVTLAEMERGIARGVTDRGGAT